MTAPPPPEVTVIVPAYNAEAFIERTIRSAAAQTHPSVEILVVNDGSTDGTAAIVDRLTAEIGTLRMITIPNGGVANARNTGIRAARSTYVAFLDADDLWHPTKIAKQVAALTRHAEDPEWAACYCLFRNINTEDLCMGNGATRYKRGAFLPSHLVVNHVGNGSSLLVRREAALAVGGFEPRYAAEGMGGCEDWDFQLRLLQRYRIEVVSEYLVGYRTYPGNMSSNHQKMARGAVALCAVFTPDPRLPGFVRRMAWSASYRLAMLHLLLDRDWRGVFATLARSFRHDPVFTVQVFLQKAPPLAWPILRAVVAKLVRIALRRPKKPRADRKHRPEFAAMDPTDGVLAQDAERRIYRHARLDAADRAFGEVLHAAPPPRPVPRRSDLPI